MSADEDFEVVCRAWAAFSRGDVPATFELVTDDVELVPFGAAFQGKAFRGRDGIVDWWENEIVPNWESFQTLPERFWAAGRKLVVFGHWRARGRASGVELDMPATWVVELRDGRIAYWQTFTDRSEALAAAGVTEEELEAI